MKFKCYKCKEETSFDKSDYVGSGRFQKPETVIKLMTTDSLSPKLRSKEIIIKCSNPKCEELNKLTITYYE